MLKNTLITILIILFGISLFGQQASFNFPKKQIERFQSIALEKISRGGTELQYKNTAPCEVSGIGQLQQYGRTKSPPHTILHNESGNYCISDTLFIVDTLEITGIWMHAGAIVIANNGFLHFNKADATILGDIFLIGEHPKLVSDSSTLYIPQAYFYQRVLFATGGARVIYRNTTVDHSGLSHNIILADSAKLELTNVINKGFTTNGIYDHSEVNVNGINEAGEYVVTDASVLKFMKASTVLLWHHFPMGAVVNFAFPEGDTVYNYHFNKTVSGVSGIDYDIFADSCYNVMWGMMPESSTGITISDSKIRAIGLWFMGADSVNVNGLVDNSAYSGFDAPLSDRLLRLNNCSVKTWSLYPMEHAIITVKNCIVGEIGAGGSSHVNGDQFFCDGSGGYVWSSDSALLIAGFSYVSGYVRSQAKSILYYAYSSLAGGYPSALQNSILIVLQSMLLQEPKALDKSVAWYAFIDQPFAAQVGGIVPVTGSVWIDKTPESTLMDFGSFRLYYQLNGAETWAEIPVDSLNEKRHETLGIWNTEGLQAGQYLIKLVVRDSWGNSAEAVKSVSLQPSFGLEENGNPGISLFPNPARGSVCVGIPPGISCFSLKITDMGGKTVMIKEVKGFRGRANYELNIGALQPGSYMLTLSGSDFIFSSLVEVR